MIINTPITNNPRTTTPPPGTAAPERRRLLRSLRLLAACCLMWPADTNAADTNPLVSGNHNRQLVAGGLTRSYQIHIPPDYNSDRPTPVVIALHGAAMNGPLMAAFCGMNETADKHGFIVVYPNGTGTGPFLVWNAGGLTGHLPANRVDDVAFISSLLDDLATVVKVDAKRTYACGMSNGGMMCYRLAAELSGRIAAIAPVAGTIAISESKPSRPVSVLHFHGTKDMLVPFAPIEHFKGMHLLGVADSIRTWIKLNGCTDIAKTDILSKEGDELMVTRQTYSGGTDGAEVVLIRIEGGGHTWPGRIPMGGFLGKSTTSINANTLIWEFFQQHPLTNNH